MTRAIAALSFVALLRGSAVADEEPSFTIGASPVWFLLGGVSGGATVAADDDRGGFLGGELSLVRLVDGRFAGLYADSTYDFGVGAAVLSAGPEVGLHLRRGRDAIPLSLGVDAGVALRFLDRAEVGASGRISVTVFGLFSIYGRYLYLDAEDEGDHVLQAGAMLKFPLVSPFGSGTAD